MCFSSLLVKRFAIAGLAFTEFLGHKEESGTGEDRIPSSSSEEEELVVVEEEDDGQLEELSIVSPITLVGLAMLSRLQGLSSLEKARFAFSRIFMSSNF